MLRFPFRYALPLFSFLSFLSLGFFLLASRAGGFPLDDAWIHQTYARNLGAFGQFAFVPGQPSAGSTSPLWSGLLALGYLFRVDYRVWAYALGAALLSLNAWLVYRLALNLWPERARAALLAGAFAALEWHMAWAAASGMETLLFSALALAVFVIPPRRAGWLGVGVGLSVLARPDGLTLLPFVLGRVLSGGCEGRRAAVKLVPACLLGFAAIFLPYLALNRELGGALWPNTFYAKAVEYAVLREQPLLARLWRVGLQPFVGAQALLVPGLVAAAWSGIKPKHWETLLPLGWAGAFILAYAVRLPVTYQHGRYVIPVIPVLLVMGSGGTSTLLHLNTSNFARRLFSRAWATAIGLLAIAFWIIGAGAYARDVQIIETEMVATARWVNQNTPPEALIAAHDIGALGYFGQRDILDMAGLVSPEVIPFIRDEARLRDWLTASGADYLVTFPGWYPDLVRPLTALKVFQTHAPYSPNAGGENMAVYRWPGSAQILP